MHDMPPTDPGTLWERAMRAGDFLGAWEVSDRVLAARDPATRDRAGEPYHRRWVWDGTPPDGRDVLVRCYHGLGDTLQFARFLPELRARARSVTVEAQAVLLPLLDPLANCVAFDPARPRALGECDVEIMELSHMLRRGPGDVPAPCLARPFAPAETRTAALCWQAGGWDPERSVKLEALRAALPGWRLLSVPRGPAAAEAGAGFANPGDADPGIGRTVALLGRASLVVTVDTMVAHLAGSLGRSTVVLLRREADWRWGEGERTPWYPTARLLRQDRPGEWGGPLAELREAAG